MRKIKFRQRNKNNGRFRTWGFEDGHWINPLEQDNYVKPEESDQFTGLKDKNGKEIYEGDIVIEDDVEGAYGLENDKETKKVEWQPNELCFTIFGDSCEYEVIGNIYENPELIK